MVELKSHNNRRSLEYKKFLLDQSNESSDYFKNEEESILDKILNEKMEQYFATMFEHVKHERSLILLLSLTDPDFF